MHQGRGQLPFTEFRHFLYHFPKIYFIRTFRYWFPLDNRDSIDDYIACCTVGEFFLIFELFQ